MANERLGSIYTAFAYVLWGILPLYWKLIDHVWSEEILAHRIIWSFIFMIILVMFQKRSKELLHLLTNLLKSPKLSVSLLLSSAFISVNWFIYIWAVNHDRVLETSLGYYINPLISVLLGVVFLKEKMNRGQQIAFIVAGIGVLNSTIQYGKIPWISLLLAMTFGLYGLTKKVTKLDSTFGLTLETLVVFPAGIVYVVYLHSLGESAFFQWNWLTNVLLMGGGIVTAIPLLLFAMGASRIPLYMVGIFQYIAPTLTFLMGVFLFHEPFSMIDFITFSFIWCGIMIFTISQSKFLKRWRFNMGKSYEAK
ncbi:EamA family transporter RarD [Bacillus alveayuensis]|jgi:chloramphenicol-sensitive protein RarD|uniref:Chloramphenicol-sensitive protein RarD n=1 Tax=Aeribacillus alveayuensis TaxID=279215 RepID=A0ABT9VP50_9BACI|nr:EamA family transporter RarD [Bacillus alveayuensis]MDQ0162756.1 chloramphenicol-sensitive protein RarD [Bacillus alveayuensis]